MSSNIYWKPTSEGKMLENVNKESLRKVFGDFPFTIETPEDVTKLEVLVALENSRFGPFRTLLSIVEECGSIEVYER